MTLTANATLGVTPVLSPEDGWQYHPSTFKDPFIKERARQLWKSQATHFMRRSTVCHRDPIAVALILDGLLRMEHNHAMTSVQLAAFMNHEYHQFIWSTINVAKIMGDLAEAALVPKISAEDCPITTYRDNTRGLRVFRINTRPMAWRWLNQMRFAIGELAQRATHLDGDTVTARKETFWVDFPWDLAELS